MAIHDEAELVLKLYDLRREATMRTARDWFAREFHPDSLGDIEKALMSENSGYVRMVTSYWEMAAALVTKGAISVQLFTGTNGEYFGVFSKLEPFMKEIRAKYGPQFMINLEKVIDQTPNGRERVAAIRERLKAFRPQSAAAK